MADPTITIRRALPADAELLARMGRQTFFDSFAADNTPENMAAYLDSAFSPKIQAAELADPHSTFLIAEVEEIPVGYARLFAGPPPEAVTAPGPVELVRIYAVKDWIGRGVGAALMQACLEEAAYQDYRTIWLGVWQRNPRALAFYEKWGFERAGTHTFQLGNEAQTDWIMQRPILLTHS
ncbi:MAG: GNAT family N-acetyltransferase [Anaerolineaceae bacterium]|nr:GNAT family N-acetyltransferase [Anaerolineaceae bacterium]